MGLPRRPLRSSLPLAPPVRPAWALVESAGQVHGAAQLRWFRLTDPAHSAGQDSGPLRAPIDWRLSGLFVFAVDCSVTVTVSFGHNGEGEEEIERETAGTHQTILRDLRRRVRAAAPSPRQVLLVELPRGGVESEAVKKIKFRRIRGQWRSLTFSDPRRMDDIVKGILEDRMAEVRAFKNSVKQAAGELAAQRRRDAVEYALRARTGPVDASCLVKEARIIEKYLAKG